MSKVWGCEAKRRNDEQVFFKLCFFSLEKNMVVKVENKRQDGHKSGLKPQVTQRSRQITS